MESIKSLTIYGLILFFLVPMIGVPLLLIDAILVYFSFRPYWQINKTYVTGEMGALESFVSYLGELAAKFGGWFIRFLWNCIVAIIKLAYYIATGAFFR